MGHMNGPQPARTGIEDVKAGGLSQLEDLLKNVKERTEVGTLIAMMEINYLRALKSL